MTSSGRKRASAEKRREKIVGLVVLVVIAVALYLSYTALSGPPWQSKFAVNVELPNAKRLLKNDAVRIAGVRVGRVVRVEAVSSPGGQPPKALVHLALEGSARRLPVDTRVKVRAASVLGANYLALIPGHSTRLVEEGATIPLSASASSVDLTDMLDLFDRSASRKLRSVIGSAGTGLAGRGPALNGMLASAAELMPSLAQLGATLRAPATSLARFIPAYDRFVSALLPVRGDLGDVFAGGARTFAALHARSGALDRSLRLLPTAEGALTHALGAARPALGRLADVTAQLVPASRELVPTVWSVDRALDASRGVVRRLPGFSRQLERSLGDLGAFASRRATDGAVRKLTELSTAGLPLARTLEQQQVGCNSISLFLNEFAHMLTDWPLTGAQLAPGNPLSTTVFLAFTHLGAQGELFQQARPASDLAVNYLPHQNEQECESGNEPYDGNGQRINNPPGLQSTRHEVTSAPAASREHAKDAGLLTPPAGWKP